MPIYDWKCSECGHEFEAVAYSETWFLECPHCGCKSAKQLSAPMFKVGGKYTAANGYACLNHEFKECVE